MLGKEAVSNAHVWQPALPSLSTRLPQARNHPTVYPPSSLDCRVTLHRAPNLALHMQREAALGIRKTLFTPTGLGFQDNCLRRAQEANVQFRMEQ